MSLNTIRKRIEAMRRLEIVNEAGEIEQIGEIVNKTSSESSENPVEILVSTVLAMRQRWYETAKPRIQQYKAKYPEIKTLNELKALIDSMSEHEFCQEVFNIRVKKTNFQRYIMLKDLVDAFIKYKTTNNLSDDLEAIYHWANNVNINDLNNDPIGQIHNVGLATVQNIRLLCGIDTVKPDVHVRNALKDIGLGNDVEVVELLSKLMGYSCRELDLIFWYWGRNQSLRKEYTREEFEKLSTRRA